MSEPPAGIESTPADEELLGRLREVLQRVEPVPADVTAVAQSLLSWRDPDARLAELVADTRGLTSTVR
ncbi:MAG TPA: hypothetical protein VKA05_07475, partial [Acidimicrobiales bacterium]|nr:hypothetical protein [Acidimicrobiales bacterium]